MAFIIIPLILIAIALVGVTVVTWRKASFLRKLTPESHEMGSTWLHDMAPEVIDWMTHIPWRKFMHTVLVDIEKFLRRIRLLFSAVDRLSERLVHKVRHVHQETAKVVQEHHELRQAEKEEEEKDPDEIDMEDPEQLKQEEQRLIVAIAQAPKEADLYSDLARVYTKMRNFADAVEALATAVKLEPENEKYAKRLEFAKKRLNSAQNVVQ